MKGKLIILLSIFFIACRSTDKEDFLVEVIDVSSIELTDKLISPRELLQEVQYITLKNQDSFFLSSARKILEFNQKLLIHDKNKRELVAFDLNGNYTGRIGKKGIGPEEYQAVDDFTVDYRTNRILIFSRTDQAILEYDTNFHFIRKLRLNTWAFQVSLLETGNLAVYTGFSGEGKHNIIIFDRHGRRIAERMPYPMSEELVPFDYSGFLVGNYYTYPLSGIIYKINEGEQSDLPLWNVKFPDKRSEEKIFDHQGFLNSTNWMNEHILTRFEVGRSARELLFYYSYKEGFETGFTLGVKLASGQIFGNFNLKHGVQSKSDAFVKMFFIGPYNLPIYSHVSGYYYVATDVEHLAEFVYPNMESILKELQELDLTLYKVLSENKSSEYPIIMRFKLKEAL